MRDGQLSPSKLGSKIGDVLIGQSHQAVFREVSGKSMISLPPLLTAPRSSGDNVTMR